MEAKTAKDFWDDWLIVARSKLGNGETRGRPLVRHPFNIQLTRAWEFAESYAAHVLASRAPNGCPMAEPSCPMEVKK